MQSKSSAQAAQPHGQAGSPLDARAAVPSSGSPRADLVAPLFSHYAEPGARASGTAADGVSGAGGPLPFGEQIQKSFGHDLSFIRAHTGGSSAHAASTMGAEAYTVGRDVALPSPTLRTAAHEAYHAFEQQHGGVQLKDGVGRPNDIHEQKADEAAERVVQGQSAKDLLDAVVSQSPGPGVSSAVQHKKKVASGKAMKRLTEARSAIKHTKDVLHFGAGNQLEALRATQFNSYFRMKCMRDPLCWEIADSVKAIAADNPEALTAAKADLAHGGNCGEHAQVAFDYLRVHAVGETINRTSVNGLDHNFILIGDLGADSDSDLCVSDPWPTQATATLWEDHFAFTDDRKQIQVDHKMVADGQNAKRVIAAGLRLSARGQQMINTAFSTQDTENQIGQGVSTADHHGWIWNHHDAAAKDKKFDYHQE